MSLTDIKLSCELRGHSLDVRSVAVDNKNVIVSGSRDKTVKIWSPDGTGKDYTNTDTFKCHTNFVSSVCVIESCDDYNQRIASGSNDNTICVYTAGHVNPLTLKGHIGTVCCLAAGPLPHSLLSGSWDNTARLWLLPHSDISEPSFVELKAHNAAVWAVTSVHNSPLGATIATGSADKCIILWNSKGERIKILEGHTDCVRGIASLPDASLLSCANDATIRQWDPSGACIRIFQGHTNYIYSISLLPSLNSFLTGGEDGSVRLWKLSPIEPGSQIITDDNCIGVLYIPAQSVWTVACLPNGDFVTGSSDGLVRVFTKNVNRQADTALQSAFENEVKMRQEAASKDIGGVKITDLPGPEALLQPGKNEGQTKLIREGSAVQCYQWTEGQWQRVGDVLGAAGGNTEPTSKTMYNGKEYDYVFSVDIEDGVPPLKLPYNRGNDPWVSAQSFIHQHNLPQAYLDQVANFIIKNSDNTPVVVNSTYVDPFTGGSRYVPGGSDSTAAMPSAVNADPFTGGSSYVSQNARSSNAGALGGYNYDPLTGASSYTTHQNTSAANLRGQGAHKTIPYLHYVSFDNSKREVILEKLKNFNKNTGDGNHHITEEMLENVVKLADSPPNPDSTSLEALRQLLGWPKEIRFPVLDVTRLAIRSNAVFNQLLPAQSRLWPEIMSCLPSSEIVPANRVMALRIINNSMIHEDGRNVLFTTGIISETLRYISNLREGNIHIQSAATTILLNISVAMTATYVKGLEHDLYTATTNCMIWITDIDAMFRLLCALGNQASNASAGTLLNIIKANRSLEEKCKKMSVGHHFESEKITLLAQEVVSLLW